MNQLIDTYWPIAVAVVSLIIWLGRLETRMRSVEERSVKVAKEAELRSRQTEERVTALLREVRDSLNRLFERVDGQNERLSRIEGYCKIRRNGEKY